MTVTAAAIRRGFLDPVLDAQALNDEQRQLLEQTHIQLLVVLDMVAQARATTDRQREFQRLVAGVADRLARDLRHDELNGGDRRATSKAIARALREPLRTLIGVDEEALLAGCELSRICRGKPRLLLLSPTVEHELGKRAFALLRELLQHEGGAARDQSAGARPTATADDGPR